MNKLLRKFKLYNCSFEQNRVVVAHIFAIETSTKQAGLRNNLFESIRYQILNVFSVVGNRKIEALATFMQENSHSYRTSLNIYRATKPQVLGKNERENENFLALEF